MAHAVQKVVERCEAAEENGGLMGENSLTQLFHSSAKSGELWCSNSVCNVHQKWGRFTLRLVHNILHIFFFFVILD